MKQIICIFLIALLANNFVTAQDSGVVITGPTCIQIGDTVVYKVSNAIPGYYWGSPSGLHLLYSTEDNYNATYIVNAMFNNGEQVWYGPSFQNNRGAIILPVFQKVGKPHFRWATEENPRVTVEQIPAGATGLTLTINPSAIAIMVYQYDLSSSNTSWTFEDEKKSILQTPKSIGSQKINLNIGKGATTIKIKTIGSCDTRTDDIQLIKPD
jgi:hypothetical protein